ncbi:MAG: hypothetical protein ACOWWO_10840 [Peptococcaceae bacterium]
MHTLESYLKNRAVLLKAEYHLCCYDPAMWLEKGTLLSILNLIQGEEELLGFWSHKPTGNGPWSLPLKMLSPQQTEILKKRYWKVKHVISYKISDDSLMQVFLDDNKFTLNYLAPEKILFVYLPSDQEYQSFYYIDDLKSISEFYEMIEEYFGRFVMFDVEKNNVFVSSTQGPFGSYTLTYDNLGRKGCRNFSCVYKCPVFPLDEHLKKLTYKIALIAAGLTSEVTDILIYDMQGNVLAKLNDEGEFE